jgi:hypothetical protein
LLFFYHVFVDVFDIIPSDLQVLELRQTALVYSLDIACTI